MGGNRIQFGTSGWRAVIAEEFTFANVRLAAAAIAGHVKSRTKSPTLLIGHDPRFFSEEFARAAAEVVRAHGVGVLLCDGATPTPAIAYEILRRPADGAINFTASHNPAEYHGLKFSGPDGAPAMPEVTRDIEQRFARLADAGKPPAADGERPFDTVDLHDAYLARLAELVDFQAIRAAKLKIICDPLHGAGAGWLDRALAENGIKASAIRTDRDVLFDGLGPDVGEENLAPLAAAMRQQGADVGLATDGDADRFGILDAGGSFVQPNHVLALLYDYLVETRGWRMDAARSVASTHLLDAVAKLHGRRVRETPVGFKYVGELIKKDQIALGGEESAGLSIRGHVPEKDGILACLLVAEMLARRGGTVREQLEKLFARVGAEFWPLRVNLRLPEDVKARFVERIRGDVAEIAGRRVARTDRTDGLKLIFDDGAWLLLRLSGTEPLVRIYAETNAPEASRRLAEEAKKWIVQ
jgi:alpha-D-glucose phosphate-specific phosphoglucomutase